LSRPNNLDTFSFLSMLKYSVPTCLYRKQAARSRVFIISTTYFLPLPIYYFRDSHRLWVFFNFPFLLLTSTHQNP